MEEEAMQEIRIDGVKVMEVNTLNTYGLVLFANGEDFPHLDRRVKECAETYGLRKEEALAMVVYYVPCLDFGQKHTVHFSTWKPDNGRIMWDGDRIVESDDEARQLVREIMRENVNHFRELEKQITPELEKAQLVPALELGTPS